MFISLDLIDDLKKEFQTFVEEECEGDEYATATISIDKEDKKPWYHANGDPEKDGHYSGLPPVGLQGALHQLQASIGLEYLSITLCCGEIDLLIAP